ncbi:hypothetical protein FQZ97_1029540 [compost metagenome]
MFDLLHWNFGFDIPNALYLADIFHLEFSKAFKIRCDNTQQKVAIARHQVAFNDLWQLFNCFDESRDGFLILSRQPYADIDRKPHTEPGCIDQCNIAFDEASIFQLLHPAQTRRR